MCTAEAHEGRSTILVVDDQPGMLWILTKILEGKGYTVSTAGTAAEALAVARIGNSAAAIVDYRLPDQNGLQLFEELRKKGLTLPAILITSYGSVDLREEALALGFAAYFDKPLQLPAVLATLADIISARSSAQGS